jgi:hypothetical protein
MSKAFNEGMERARREIDRKMTAALRARKHRSNTDDDANLLPGVIDKTPAERLGIQNAKPSRSDVAMTGEADARQPFLNSLALAKVLPAKDPAVRAAGRETLAAIQHNRRRSLARLGFPEK